MKRTILRIPAVKSESGLSRSTIYLRIAQGLWTKPVSLGARAVGWPSDEVESINTARIAGKNDAEVRALVEELHLARNVGSSDSPVSETAKTKPVGSIKKSNDSVCPAARQMRLV